RPGDACILGGFGRTAGGELGNGYDWTGAQAETWGANTIDNAGWLTVISFTDPSHPSAVPHESIFAANDSGAGLFVRSAEGDLRLAGVAVSVGSNGASRYGDLAYCLNIDFVRAWLACEADFDFSGSVTVHDLYAYYAAWSDNSPRADIAGGEGVGYDDLVAFLALYLAGC
ncbi:MAG: GC-type dockerin domain-anchored protein, partial [Phycisphaerales bacterium]